MTQLQPDIPAASADAPMLERLRTHRMLGPLPIEELQWLVDHGTLERVPTGTLIVRKGQPVDAMYVVLTGSMTHIAHRGGARRKVFEWGAGDITGTLPYSRMNEATGDTVIDEDSELLAVPNEDVANLPFHCPQLTRVLVHAMLDRVRVFKSSDLQMEKLVSLGKLAAGIAHELNNPASAAARSARLLAEALIESDEASRALGAASMNETERAMLEQVRNICLTAPTTSIRSPLEQSDREEELADWLRDRGADEAFASTLAETELQVDALGELADGLQGEKLGVALRWLSAGCTVRGLARDIEQASGRVHELVSAIKGFTYMDRGGAPTPVDVRKGLQDTVAMLGAKAKKKSVAMTIQAAEDLPIVQGFGGELNQVWANLIDNALDAVAEGGRVTVTAEHDGHSVVVRVVDDGPGIPSGIQEKIFDPFFTTKPVGSGTGLGLDIVQSLVTRHDGLITMSSEPGRTEFAVSLPIVARQMPD